MTLTAANAVPSHWYRLHGRKKVNRTLYRIAKDADARRIVERLHPRKKLGLRRYELDTLATARAHLNGGTRLLVRVFHRYTGGTTERWGFVLPTTLLVPARGGPMADKKKNGPKNDDKMLLAMPKGCRERWAKAAAKKDMSRAAWIRETLDRSANKILSG